MEEVRCEGDRYEQWLEVRFGQGFSEVPGLGGSSFLGFTSKYSPSMAALARGYLPLFLPVKH